MPSNDDSPSIMIEGATLIFRNLAGLAREFNSEGDRNFSVILEKDLAEKLKAAGWRVKQLKPREDEELGDYHLKVKLNYRTGRPPRVILVTSNGRTDLGPDEVQLIDAADIKNADLIINGWWSDMAGGGYSAYLKTLFVTINEDPLEMKYQEDKEEPA